MKRNRRTTAASMMLVAGLTLFGAACESDDAGDEEVTTGEGETTTGEGETTTG